LSKDGASGQTPEPKVKQKENKSYAVTKKDKN